MEIRKLKKADIERAVQIIRENFGAQEAAKARFYFNLSLKSIATKKASGLSRIDYWIALKDKKIVGIAGLYNWLFYPEDIAWLSYFAVKRAEQRKGIGSLLYKRIESESKLRLIFVEVASDNIKARNFCAKQGFKEVAVLKDFWKKGIDQIIFMKR